MLTHLPCVAFPKNIATNDMISLDDCNVLSDLHMLTKGNAALVLSARPFEPVNVNALINRLIIWTPLVLANQLTAGWAVSTTLQSLNSSVTAVRAYVSVCVCVSHQKRG